MKNQIAALVVQISLPGRHAEFGSSFERPAPDERESQLRMAARVIQELLWSLAGAEPAGQLEKARIALIEANQVMAMVRTGQGRICVSVSTEGSDPGFGSDLSSPERWPAPDSVQKLCAEWLEYVRGEHSDMRYTGVAYDVYACWDERDPSTRQEDILLYSGKIEG